MSGGRGLTYNFFSTSGSWTCPAGVTSVFLVGIGGGAGGAGGIQTQNQYRPGGNASVPRLIQLNTVPGTTYTVTIGAGGAGGSAAATNTAATFGSNGGATVFGSAVFMGAQRTTLSGSDISSYSAMAYSFGNTGTTSTANNALNFMTTPPSGRSYSYAHSRGTNNNGLYFAGGDGAGGWTGKGGTGATANAGGAIDGGAAAAGNYGAGGGGGACRASSPGVGGAGMSGALWIVWNEGSGKLNVKTYTTPGTNYWTVPNGVTAVLTLGQGGGGAGGASVYGSQQGGYGGKATYLVPAVIDVVPGDLILLEISAQSGGDGDYSSFYSSNIFSYVRRWMGGGQGGTGAGYTTVGTGSSNTSSNNVPISPAGAINGLTANIPFYSANTGGYGSTGTRGTNTNSATNGAGGAPGNASDAGPGGNGGNGAVGAGSPGAGGNAPSTAYGAGGGGGGACSTTTPASANGGLGGSGRIIVIWSE